MVFSLTEIAARHSRNQIPLCFSQSAQRSRRAGVFESNRSLNDSTQTDMRYLLSDLCGLERSPAPHGVQGVAGEKHGWNRILSLDCLLNPFGNLKFAGDLRLTETTSCYFDTVLSFFWF
jgi:hypothetical protein